MVKVVMGDILDTGAMVICHQVNCKNAIGAGVARQICEKWPIVREKYKGVFEQVLDWHSVLGKIQRVHIGNGRYVVNIFGQDGYGKDRVYTDYDALAGAFQKINDTFAGMSVAIPHGLGCGLAGGDWLKVEELIVRYLPKCEVTIYIKE